MRPLRLFRRCLALAVSGRAAFGGRIQFRVRSRGRPGRGWRRRTRGEPPYAPRLEPRDQRRRHELQLRASDPRDARRPRRPDLSRSRDSRGRQRFVGRKPRHYPGVRGEVARRPAPAARGMRQQRASRQREARRRGGDGRVCRVLRGRRCVDARPPREEGPAPPRALGGAELRHQRHRAVRRAGAHPGDSPDDGDAASHARSDEEPHPSGGVPQAQLDLHILHVHGPSRNAAALRYAFRSPRRTDTI